MLFRIASQAASSAGLMSLGSLRMQGVGASAILTTRHSECAAQQRHPGQCQTAWAGLPEALAGGCEGAGVEGSRHRLSAPWRGSVVSWAAGSPLNASIIST